MKLYFEAEEFLKPSSSGNGGSLQSKIFNAKLTSSPKHIYAVVYSTLKYKEYINMVIKKSKLKTLYLSSIKKHKISDNLLLLLVHDLLFSPRGRIQLGKHPIKDSFLLHQTRLKAEFIKLKLKFNAKAIEDFPTKEVDGDETPVRWFRINTIKVLDEEKFFLLHTTFKNLQPVSSLKEVKQQTGVIYKDDFIPFLYGVNPREKITNTQAYLKGEIIIQDRASCFPAQILNNDLQDIHTEVIDACAAPGNKTTHSASYLPQSDDSVVYAFERDSKRCKILKMMCERATGKAKNKLIQITHADFTTTNPNDFPNVTGMVVDPSCSGSGIFGRAIQDGNSAEEEESSGQEVDVERLNKLAGFQFKIVKHALSFPLVRKVVYLTCSIHPHENERVVVDLLNDSELKEAGWTLADREIVIPTWPKRGWKEEFTSIAENEEQAIQLAGGCVRAEPKVDGGIGFFAACFIKSEVTGTKKGTQKPPVQAQANANKKKAEEE